MLICGGRSSVYGDDSEWVKDSRRLVMNISSRLAWLLRYPYRRCVVERHTKSPTLKWGSEPLYEVTDCAYATSDVSDASGASETSVEKG
jgi:hypothetical protein